MAKILNLTGKREMIFRGDAVSYKGLICLVSMHPETTATVLTDLATGEIVAEYESSFIADMDEDITLICQREDITVRLEKGV